MGVGLLLCCFGTRLCSRVERDVVGNWWSDEEESLCLVCSEGVKLKSRGSVVMALLVMVSWWGRWSGDRQNVAHGLGVQWVVRFGEDAKVNVARQDCGLLWWCQLRKSQPYGGDCDLRKMLDPSAGEDPSADG